MAKIKLNNSLTIEDAFEDFLFYKNTQGVTEQTVDYYRSSFRSLSRFLDTSAKLSELSKKDLQMMITAMRSTSLSTNSIKSFFCRILVFE